MVGKCVVIVVLSAVWGDLGGVFVWRECIETETARNELFRDNYLLCGFSLL